jgi:hypothetical protein
MVLPVILKLIMLLSSLSREKLIFRIGSLILMPHRLHIQDARNVLFIKDFIMLSKALRVMLEKIFKLCLLSSEGLRFG